MPGELVHFDIPVEDVDKAVDFYRNVMGWKIEKYEGEGMEYWMVYPDPGNESAVGGGIGKKAMPEQTTINYYTAQGGIDVFNTSVRDNGGTVLMEKMSVPGWGWFSVCMDPEGNPFGGWVDDKSAK